MTHSDNMAEDELRFHKKYLAEHLKAVTRKDLEESAKRAQEDNILPELIAKSNFRVIILADNKDQEVEDEFILRLQDKIASEGFPCKTGSQLHKALKGAFLDYIEKQIIKEDLIIMINGVRPGSLDESKFLRLTPEAKKKTLFFFNYSDFEKLKQCATEKLFPIDYKFPVPFKDNEELEAKVVFGVLH